VQDSLLQSRTTLFASEKKHEINWSLCLASSRTLGDFCEAEQRFLLLFLEKEGYHKAIELLSLRVVMFSKGR
jgi:hypothetical protein